MRQVGPNGLDLVRHAEGCVLSVYLDSVGLPTVGVGHLVRDADGLTVGDAISSERANEFLQHDLADAASAVDRNCPHLSQNEFDACVSLTFNIGGEAFGRSTLRRMITAGNIPGAAEQFEVWNRAGNTHPRGLTIRRSLERDLFLAPDGPMPVGWLSRHDHDTTVGPTA